MIPFGTVQDSFFTNAGALCYSYSTSTVDSGIDVRCPSGNFTNGPGGTRATPTTNTTKPLPSITENPLADLWLQNWIISLVPGQDPMTVGSMSLHKRSLDITTVRYNETVVAPDSHDRCDLDNLRVPGKLDAGFMERMRIDPLQAEASWQLAKDAVVELNLDPNRWSKVALRHWCELNPGPDCDKICPDA
jgi:hypothetical protein